VSSLRDALSGNGSMHHRTDAGRAFRTLNILDERSRECPSWQHGFAMRLPGNGTIRVKRKLNSTEVIDALTDLFILRSVPAYIRSELPIEGAIGSSPVGDRPEFIAEAVRDWIKAIGAKTANIEPRSLLSGHRRAMPCRAVLGRTDTANVSMANARRVAQRRDILFPTRSPDHHRKLEETLNTKRPHSALGYRPPAPEPIVPVDHRPLML